MINDKDRDLTGYACLWVERADPNSADGGTGMDDVDVVVLAYTNFS